MCLVYYAYSSDYSLDFLNEHLGRFTQSTRSAINSYATIDERKNKILSNMLLIYGLQQLFPAEEIRAENIIKSGKPIYKGLNVHFNLSHSGDLVVAVFSLSQEVGIDIERIRKYDIDVVNNFLNPIEINNLGSEGDSLFYDYWTKKEALVKLAGTGIEADFTSINCSENYAQYQNRAYYFTPVSIDKNYVCHLATKTPVHQLKSNKVDL